MNKKISHCTLIILASLSCTAMELPENDSYTLDESNFIGFIPKVPVKLAEKYFALFSKQMGQQPGLINCFVLENQNDECARFMDRYVKRVVETAHQLRLPGLPPTIIGKEFQEALMRINSDINEKTYIVTGTKNPSALISPQQWDEKLEEFNDAVISDYNHGIKQ